MKSTFSFTLITLAAAGLSLPQVANAAGKAITPGSISTTIGAFEPALTKLVDLPVVQLLGTVSLTTLVPQLGQNGSPLVKSLFNIPVVGTLVNSLPTTVVPIGEGVAVLQNPLPGLGALDAALAAGK